MINPVLPSLLMNERAVAGDAVQADCTCPIRRILKPPNEFCAHGGGLASLRVRNAGGLLSVRFLWAAISAFIAVTE